jgi:hypothetical protein
VRRVYRVVAIVAATSSLLVNFGVIDLIDGLTGAFTSDTTWVLDAGWGVLFGVLIPVGLLASLRAAAGVQQIALITMAIAVAVVAGEAWRWSRARYPVARRKPRESRSLAAPGHSRTPAHTTQLAVDVGFGEARLRVTAAVAFRDLRAW